MLNAIKEQQAQIQQQRELIERQQALAVRQQQELNGLKKLACRSHRRARVCRDVRQTSVCQIKCRRHEMFILRVDKC